MDNRDLVFLALAARAISDDNEYANRVNAYIMRGYNALQAEEITRTWYAAHRRVRYFAWVWQLLAAGCFALSMDVIGSWDIGNTAELVAAGLCGLRAWYCTVAERRSIHQMEDGLDWLQVYGF